MPYIYGTKNYKLDLLDPRMREQENISAIDQYIIDFIRNLRLAKSLTQDDVANILHVSRSFISDIESSKRIAKYNVSHVNALADYFNISPRDFLPEKAIPVDQPSKDQKKVKAVSVKKKSTVKKTAGKSTGK